MINGESVMKLITRHGVMAEELLANSNLQFKIVGHDNWCRYDAQQKTFVDPLIGNAPVPCRIEDVEAFRVGNAGTVQRLLQTEEMIGVGR